MTDAVHKFLSHSWGLFVLGIPFLGFWSIAIRMLYVYAKIDIAQLGYPATHQGPQTILSFIWRMSDYWFLFGARTANRLQTALRLFVLFATILAILRSMSTHRADEFSRAGAIITVIGLLAAFVGIIESQRVKKNWSRLSAYLNNTTQVSRLQLMTDRHLDKTQFSTGYLSLIVSTYGTLIWAYGDQILKCNWPAFFLDDIAICKIL